MPPVSWKFWRSLEIGDMLVTIRCRRAAMTSEPIPESMIGIQEARLRLANALETSADTVQYVQRNVHYARKTMLALDHVIAAAAADLGHAPITMSKADDQREGRPMPWQFLDLHKIDEMRKAIRGRRTIMLSEPVPESMAAVHEARLRLADALEASADQIEAVQKSIHFSWQAVHALNKLVQEAPKTRPEEIHPARRRPKTPSKSKKGTKP